MSLHEWAWIMFYGTCGFFTCGVLMTFLIVQPNLNYIRELEDQVDLLCYFMEENQPKPPTNIRIFSPDILEDGDNSLNV